MRSGSNFDTNYRGGVGWGDSTAHRRYCVSCPLYYIGIT